LELILEANSSEEVEFNKTFDTGEGERGGERGRKKKGSKRERVFMS